MRLDRELTCAEVVELVTDYLELRLGPVDAERFEEHLAFCDGCDRYVHQMRATIAASGQLREEDLPPELQERLVDAFRDWRAQ
jgi:predicted anti-sigma-YlaC factor YlaD